MAAGKYGAAESIVEDNGWYDLFLIHPDGDVFHTRIPTPWAPKRFDQLLDSTSF